MEKQNNSKLIEKYHQINMITSHIRNLTVFFLLDNQDFLLKHQKIDSVYIYDFINLNQKLKIKLEKGASSISKMKKNKILIGSFNENYNLKIIELKDKNSKYEILCMLTYKNNPVISSIELSNEMIAFSNNLGEIYLLDKKSEKEYVKNKIIKEEEGNDNILLYELPNKEIMGFSFKNKGLIFWGNNNFSFIKSLQGFDINKMGRQNISILNDSLLGFIINKKVKIIDYINKQIVDSINVEATCIYTLNDKSVILGVIEYENDYIHYQFLQYQLNENKLKLISKKENAQGNEVDFIIQNKNGNILSSSNNNIKIFN